MFLKSELAQSAIEYALVLVGVSLVMALVMVGFGTGLLDEAGIIISGWLA